jgi:hypothetical protein
MRWLMSAWITTPPVSPEDAQSGNDFNGTIRAVTLDLK